MSWIAVGVGVIGGVASIVSRSNANKKMKKLQEENEANAYQENPEARKRFAMAQTLLNARMPGASAIEKNIFTTGANQLSQVQRNATDSSQLLGLGAAIQGQQGQQLSDLGIMEQQDYQRRYANQENAREGLIEEGDKVRADKNRIFSDKVQTQGAISQNNQNSWHDVSNMGFSMANFGANGGFSSGMGQNFWGGNTGQGGYQPNMNDIAGMQRNMYNPQTIGR